MGTTPGVSRAGASAAAASRTCTSGAAIRTSIGHCHKTIAQERPRMRTGAAQARGGYEPYLGQGEPQGVRLAGQVCRSGPGRDDVRVMC